MPIKLEDVQEEVERELARLRALPEPQAFQVVGELTRELRYRRRVYPGLVVKGNITHTRCAEQIWIVEYLLGEWQRRRVRQREEQST